MRGPEPVAPDSVGAMEDALQAKLGGSLRLIVRSVASRDTDRQGFLYEAKPEEAPPPDPKIEALRGRVRDVLERRLRRQPARALSEVVLDASGATLKVHAVVTATLPVRPTEVAAVEAALRRYVDSRLRLTVRTVLESEASASSWVDRR